MQDKELLKNFKVISKNLQELNKLVLLVVNVFYNLEEESSGSLELDIEDVKPRSYNNYRGYLG
jgi:hypothetical protein